MIISCDGLDDPARHILTGWELRRVRPGRPDGLRAALEQHYVPVLDGELDVLRRGLPTLDLLAELGECQHLLVGQARLRPPHRVHVDGGRGAVDILDPPVTGPAPKRSTCYLLRHPARRPHPDPEPRE